MSTVTVDRSRARVGGMAMPDGVYMRTDRAWALARTDGTVKVGHFRRSTLPKVPGVRILIAVAAGFGALAKGAAAPQGSRGTRRFIAVVVALSAGHWLAGQHFGFASGLARSVADPLFALIVLAAMRLVLPSSLWRLHGAEHKAISAYESGVDLGDRRAVAQAPRLHDRCGTNLVFLLLVLTPVPAPRGAVGVLLPLALVGLTAEMLSFAVRHHPGSAVTRALVAGGRLLQRTVTVREPTTQELEVGVRALEACLTEHAVQTRSVRTGLTHR